MEESGFVKNVPLVIKLARTIADLAGVDQIQTIHLAEAIQYRGVDRKSG